MVKVKRQQKGQCIVSADRMTKTELMHTVSQKTGVDVQTVRVVYTAIVTFIAAIAVGWWVALPCLLGVPPLVIGLRWYLNRAKDGYLRESATYSQINSTLTETVEGARTVEALGAGGAGVAKNRSVPNTVRPISSTTHRPSSAV